MPQRTIPDVDERTFEVLRERAERPGRSVETEARHILVEAAQPGRTSSWAALDAFRERLAATGRDFGDSTEEIREDRER